MDKRLMLEKLVFGIILFMGTWFILHGQDIKGIIYIQWVWLWAMLREIGGDINA